MRVAPAPVQGLAEARNPVVGDDHVSFAKGVPTL